MKSSLLTIDQLAEKLQVTKSWIYARTRVPGGIPRCENMGRLLRFDEAEVEAWYKSKGSLKFKRTAKCES